MRNKYLTPTFKTEELTKIDVLCASYGDDNDNIDYSGDRNSLLRSIGDFVFKGE